MDTDLNKLIAKNKILDLINKGRDRRINSKFDKL